MIGRQAILAWAGSILLTAFGVSGAVAAPQLGQGLSIANVTQTSALIGGSVSPSAPVAYYHVEYGPTTSYGSSGPDPEGVKYPYTCTAGQSAGDCVAGGMLNNQVTVQLASLTPGTTYHVRLAAHDASGSAYGEDATFTTLPPGPAPVDIAPPHLNGRAMVGGALTCTPGSWSGASSLAFAWLRNGVVVADATDSAYDPGAADAGTQIACRVTASSPGDADGTAQTSAVLVAHESLHLTLPTRTASVTRNGTMRLRISCLNVVERCRADLVLSVLGGHAHRRPPTLAQAHVVLAPGTSGRVTLTLNRRARRLLAAAPGRRLKVSARLGAKTQTLQLTESARR